MCRTHDLTSSHTQAAVTGFKRAELELTLQLEDHARFIKEQQAAEALAARRLAELQRHLRRMLADDDEAGMYSGSSASSF